MAVILQVFDSVLGGDGVKYHVRACGREHDDGIWDGWIEFEDETRGRVLRSALETSQPDFTAITRWGSGLTPLYLEGALKRILDVEVPLPFPELAPAFNEPAPSRAAVAVPSHAVLDPYLMYAKHLKRLTQQLRALSREHLLQIIRAYGLVDEYRSDINTFAKAELADLIVQRVAETIHLADHH